jgi:hypothetical protein
MDDRKMLKVGALSFDELKDLVEEEERIEKYRERIELVKARVREADGPFERIAAYNSEGVIVGVLALDELRQEGEE